jgi:hypothetical protein
MSDITNIMNNFNSHSEEKIKFNIQLEKDLSKFLGKKVKGNKQGLCCIYWKENDEFKGIFKKNLAEGYGIRKFKNGEYFHGEFVKDVANGFGIYTNSSASCYSGYFQDNLHNGYGIILFNLGFETYSDGSTYEGEYFNGKKHGLGRNIWTDGSKYEGYWYENIINGYV